MTESATSTAGSHYLQANLPPSIVNELEAGAFRSLCEHLKERSDEVQNIDLMSVGGFCRNCLAKWMVIEARKISQKEGGHTLEVLNALGYDEAAQYVYGCNYDVWKERHAKKATEDQIQKYNDSTPIHSVFDKEILAKRTEILQLASLGQETTSMSSIDPNKSLLSNVCCQGVDDDPNPPTKAAPLPPSSSIPAYNPKNRSLGPYIAPEPPMGGITFSLTVITVSDRAFRNEYETGDLSGPAVQRAVRQCVTMLSTMESPVVCHMLENDIVVIPDDITAIQSKLKECAAAGVDLVLTTGGTGFAARDVTPEATLAVVQRECHGLMPFVTTECSKVQALASLSRGTAGVLRNTMICNLPGNPNGVDEIVPILLPIVIHAIYALQNE